MNQNEIMSKLHDAQFELLQVFDDICQKHHITYYLAAGTLLGAVRHKDFIPWDDDMDIYMHRKDYMKFIKCIDEFQDPFELHIPNSNDPYFWDFTTRLVNKRCVLKPKSKVNEYYCHHNNEYLFLDIFILDRTYNGLRNKIQVLFLKILYGLALGKRLKINYSDYKSVLAKMQTFILANIGKHVSYSKVFDAYQRVATRYNRDSNANYEQPSNITVKFLGKLLYKREWHVSTTELYIRNKKFMGPKLYDDILKSVYGDYLTLPPLEKRIPEHLDTLKNIKFR